MSSVTFAPSDRMIYRKSVMYVVLPNDLRRHLNEVHDYYAHLEGVEVVVERRDGADRRQNVDGAPEGVERRVGDRREEEAARTAAEVGVDLPRSLRRHAGRITCTWRSVPVHFQDAEREADLLLAAADTDSAARDELRLRYYQRVYSSLGLGMTSTHRKLVLAESVFDDLFAHHESNAFSREVENATWRVTSNRWSRNPSFTSTRAFAQRD